MIREVVTRKGSAAITSDQWHVVHSRFTTGHNDAPFLRDVFSEHVDHTDCLKAAKELCATLKPQNAAMPAAERDQVFVRRPHYKTLRRARRRKPKRW